jgi:hypothetical protein
MQQQIGLNLYVAALPKETKQVKHFVIWAQNSVVTCDYVNETLKMETTTSDDFCHLTFF